MSKNLIFLNAKNRLIHLRPLSKDDFASWQAGYLNELPLQHKYDSPALPPEKLTKTAFLIRLNRYQTYAENDQIYVLGVFCAQTGIHLGTIDIATILRNDTQWANIGYSIHNQHWRKGYASSALKEALIIAFKSLKFHRIEAAINLDNLPSIELVKKLGFTYEGIRRSFIFEDGEWTGHHIYSMIPSDIGLKNEPPTMLSGS